MPPRTLPHAEAPPVPAAGGSAAPAAPPTSSSTVHKSLSKKKTTTLNCPNPLFIEKPTLEILSQIRS